ERRAQRALALERCLQLRPQLIDALRLEGGDGDRLADRARRFVVGRRGLRLGLGSAALLPFELRTEAGSEALLGRARHQKPKTLERLIRAGPSTTTNIAGKTKMTVGNSILIGAFIAFSSAAAWRFKRVSTAWTRRILPSEMPSWSAWMIARTNADSSGESTRAESFFKASWRAWPTRISAR